VAIRLHESDIDLEETHEINVTPFIDVILVLLIIFMVAAPLATVDVPVDLPGFTIEPQPRPEQPVFLTLKSDLSLTVGDNPTTLDALPAALTAAIQGDKSERIFLRADKIVTYRSVMEIMNRLRDAGYLKVALVGLENRDAK